MAVATDILEAVKAALEAEFPGVPVRVRKRGVSPDVDPFGGYNAGDPKEMFIVSAASPEAVDDLGTFEHVSVRYEATVAHVRRTDLQRTEDDAGVRQSRERIRGALHRASDARFPGVLTGYRFRSGEPFDTVANGHLATNVSSETLSFTAFEPRKT